MTVIITINHFFINYAFHGNPKNVILNRIAILFKFIVYIQLFISNSQLALSRTVLIKNAFLFLTDFVLLLLLVSMESQFDSFNSLRRELLNIKREKRKKE